MTEALYVKSGDIVPADMANCDDGLFQSLHSDLFNDVLITSINGTRFAAYLRDPKGISYLMLAKENVSARAGILWPKPEIEVNPATQYDARKRDEAIGDIVIDGRGIWLFARNKEGRFDDAEPVPLWNPQARETTARIGFREWRLVSGKGIERRVLFEWKASD